MLSVLSEVKEWVGLVISLWVWLALGGAIGFLGGLFRPWLGFPGVAVGGAAIMAVAVIGEWAGDDSDRIARLQEENARLQAKEIELRLTGQALRDTLKALGEAAEHNEKVVADLRTKLDTVQDDPACIIGKDIVDDLNQIR